MMAADRSLMSFSKVCSQLTDLRSHSLMTGLLSTTNGACYGFGWGFFGAQVFGILVIDLWAAVCGFVLFYGIKKLHGLRVGKRVEEEGLDIYEHGEACYN